MALQKKWDLYMNCKGGKPMTFVRSLESSDPSLTESGRTTAAELAVELLNRDVRPFESQLVIVEDDLIVAIEGLTTRKLIWCN